MVPICKIDSFDSEYRVSKESFALRSESNVAD